MREQEHRRERAIRVKDLGVRRLKELSDGEERAHNAEALVKVGILLAHQASEGHADTIIENLLPHVSEMDGEQASAFCELLTIRGRIIDAEEIAERMNPVRKMITQMRCLPSRLTKAAANHREEPDKLEMIVDVMLHEPIASLETLLKDQGRNRRASARAAMSGLNLLTRTLQTAILREPVLGPIIGRITAGSGGVEDERAVEQGAREIAESLLAKTPSFGGHSHRMVDEANALWDEEIAQGYVPRDPGREKADAEQGARMRKLLNESG